jgi:hypothetical protein
MFDPLLRPLVDPPLDRAGAWLAARGASANAMTLGGLGICFWTAAARVIDGFRVGADNHD